MSDIQDLNVEEEASQDYQKLQNIGAQKIHEQTHIPKVQSEELVHGNFESMNRVQFLGFVSILQREYSLELNGLKNDGIEFFKQDEEDEQESKVFVTPKKSKNYTIYYLIIALIIILIVALVKPSDKKKVEPTLDNKKIEQVTKKIQPKELNTSMLAQQEIKVVVPEVKKEIEVVVAREFKIIPKTKLWIGYIDLNTGKKRQKVISEAFELEAKGHWLLSFGHGHVDLNVDGNITKYKEPKNVRFLYKDGELKKITYTEFLGLNKGKAW